MLQNLPEKISPIAFNIGSLEVHWYGIMYLAALSICYSLLIYRSKTEKRFSEFTKEKIENFLFYTFIGVLVGARLGYGIFYNLEYFIANPLELILPFSLTNGFHFTGFAGMSFHGGLIGAIIAGGIFAKKKQLKISTLGDFLIPAFPLGYFFGRLGNFINGELWGRITNSNFGMYFPNADENLRHPSQLYEAFFEGIVLFLILWLLRKKVKNGSMLGLYLILYGLIRFVIEFFREPDAHIGLLLWKLSMGQLLCAVMILAGLILLKLNQNEKT